MHGNVWQWTQGGFNNKSVEKEDDGGELVARASLRVFRGGGWDSVAGDCRAAIRNGGTPVNRDDDRGFRLARVPVGAEGK
jgi:formylglycine-generating enzyme required for sulfatase activity